MFVILCICFIDVDVLIYYLVNRSGLRVQNWEMPKLPRYQQILHQTRCHLGLPGPLGYAKSLHVILLHSVTIPVPKYVYYHQSL